LGCFGCSDCLCRSIARLLSKLGSRAREFHLCIPLDV